MKQTLRTLNFKQVDVYEYDKDPPKKRERHSISQFTKPESKIEKRSKPKLKVFEKDTYSPPNL